MLRALILCLLTMLPGLAWASECTSDLKTFLATSTNLPYLSTDERAELDRIYALRGYHIAWSTSDDVAVKKTADFLESINVLVTYHGFDPRPYHLDEMRKLLYTKDSDKTSLELMITQSLLRLAHDLHGDTTDLESLYTGWNFHRAPLDIPVVLNDAINTGKIAVIFDRFTPQQQAYRDLAKILQDYEAIAAKGGWHTLSAGGTLRPGDSDPRIAELRARLTAEDYVVPSPSNGQNDYFDEALSKVLIIYQTRNGLSPDGRLGGKTQEALNTSVDTRINQIRANMERWRHMPETFPTDHFAEINIPDFSIAITDDNKEIYRGIVIVGRTDRQTPFIDSKITNMLINPSWHVPLKIARKDILPKLRHDPHYLEKLGFVIAGRDYDPTGATIDWTHMSPEAFHYQLRQTPGDMNSLGQLKFNFVNPFDVYMHGTPHQELFDKAERDFSSGCVRLEDPVEVGELLLSHTKDAKGPWSEERIQAEIDSGKSYFVTLANPMPIYFLYWSVFTTDDGEANFRKDIYGYDQMLADKVKGAAD